MECLAVSSSQQRQRQVLPDGAERGELGIIRCWVSCRSITEGKYGEDWKPRAGTGRKQSHDKEQRVVLEIAYTPRVRPFVQQSPIHQEARLELGRKSENRGLPNTRSLPLTTAATKAPMA